MKQPAKTMKKSAKTALGGITASLSLVLMLLTAVFPFLTYAAPEISGTLLVIMVIELNKKWAFGAYAAVSLLSLFILPDKEAAMMYVGFFGFYPILKPILEQKLAKPLSIICKFIVFNASVTLSYLIIVYVFAIPFDGMEEFGKWAIPALLAMGNVVFILYDVVLSRLITMYLNRWQKKFHSIFKL